jgi:hypothetical protein
MCHMGGETASHMAIAVSLAIVLAMAIYLYVPLSRYQNMKKSKELTLREHLQAIQSQGGKARWAGLTAEERSAAARKAVQVRWAKNKVTAAAADSENTTMSKSKGGKG